MMFNHSLLSSLEGSSTLTSNSALCEARNGISYTLWKSFPLVELKQEWFLEELELNDGVPVSTASEERSELSKDPLDEFLNRYATQLLETQ